MKSMHMKWMALIAATLLSPAVFAGQGMAAGFQEPKVEYSADQYIATGDKILKSKVYYAPKKQRMDVEETGGEQYIITRLDRKVFWIVMPEQKMYMERGLTGDAKTPGEQARDLRECNLTRKGSGKETVNGVSATRSAIEMSCPDGANFSGDIWESKDGILVKMDVTARDGSTAKASIKTELKNLKIGKQDPKLFEVPSGYRQMSMPIGISPGMGAIPEVKEISESPETEKQPEDVPRKEQGTVEKGADAIKKLKGIFGR
jgi:hypothetical protein